MAALIVVILYIIFRLCGVIKTAENLSVIPLASVVNLAVIAFSVVATLFLGNQKFLFYPWVIQAVAAIALLPYVVKRTPLKKHSDNMRYVIYAMAAVCIVFGCVISFGIDYFVWSMIN